MLNRNSHRRLWLLLLLALGVGLSGCSWLNSLKQTEEGATFPKWSQDLSGSIGSATQKKEAKSKSLFFDERSRAVEKSIGYEE
jgi:uncharacterized protein YceK